MHEPRQKLEVLFTNPNISYADRLLLKQHRRGQLKLKPSDDSMDSNDMENGGDGKHLKDVHPYNITSYVTIEQMSTLHVCWDYTRLGAVLVKHTSL